MTTAAWPWLPAEACSDSTAVELLDAVIADWSRRWLGTRQVKRGRLSFDAMETAPSAEAMTRADVQIDAGQTTALMSLALDIELDRLELTEPDQLLIDNLQAELLSDLATQLSAGLDVRADENAASPLARLELADAQGRRVASVSISQAALARTRLRQMPKPLIPSSALTPFKQALADQTLRMVVTVGSAEVPMTEARALGVGDVIVLDRRLDEPLDLSASTDSSPVLGAILSDTTPPVSLSLRPLPRKETT